MDMLYKLDGGDGVGDFFSSLRILKKINCKWFDNRLANREAILFDVENWQEGQKFKYIALTSRSTFSIEEQLQQSHVASVVVHGIEYDKQKFPNLKYGVLTIGMSFLESHQLSES